MNGIARGVPLAAAEHVEALEARWGGTVDGAVKSRLVDRVVAPEDARAESDLVVVTLPKWVAVAQRSPGVLLCAEPLAQRLPPGRRWVHRFVWWAVNHLVKSPIDLEPEREPDAQVHPGAIVDPTARIRRGAVVRAGARIGPGCDVGENSVIYGGVHLGARVVVGPLSVVGRQGFGWAEGPDGEVLRIFHRGGVVLEDDVEVGALCTVDAGTLRPTRLSSGVKLDAHVHVGHNVEIGAGTVVAAQAGFAGSVRLGAGVLVGGQAGFADHVRVGGRARIAAKSGVIGDIPDGSVVAGFPAIPRMRWLRAMATLLRGTHGE